MPTEAQELRREGFEANLEASGEPLKLMNGGVLVKKVDALVNRGLDTAGVQQGQVAFTELSMSHIEVLQDEFDAIPDTGWSFKDDQNMFHRIRTVRRTDNTYIFECESAMNP